MLALRYTHRKLSVETVATPEGNGEALVRVVKSGICNTDLEIARGYAGFEGTLGHEFVGVVEQSDEVGLVGKRVVGEINAGCGVCEECDTGDSRHCPTRTVLGIVGRDGAHAEFLRLPVRNLLEVPDSISDEEAVFVEPLAAALGIIEPVPLGHDEKIAVIGDGKLGLLCAIALARSAVGEVLLIGKHESKMRFAAAAGIETLNLQEVQTLRDKRFDIVVEASGSASGLETALTLLRPRGTIVLKSTFHGNPSWPAARIVVDEVSVVGSRCGRFAPALDFLAKQKLNVSHLISEQHSLSDGINAMRAASRTGVLKVILQP